MPLATYSPKDVKVSFNGITITGFAPDSFIRLKRFVEFISKTVGSQGDLSLTKNSFLDLKNYYSEKFLLVIGTSTIKKEIPKDFGKIVFKFLGRIKVYTMHKGVVAEKPLILDCSLNQPTIRDVAIKIHRSFYESFDHATVIRKDDKQEKKKVGLDYELKENDIIELHTK